MIDLTKVIAAASMNKFAAFAMETQSNLHFGKHLTPKFLNEVKWTNKQDIVNAWERYSTTDEAVERNAVLSLYSFLGDKDKIALLEWVMDNYNTETKIDFGVRV